MILFPSCLGFMAKMTRPTKHGVGRFAAGEGVEVVRSGDSVRVSATDLKTLFTVTAKPDHLAYPELPGDSFGSDALAAVVIPAAEFEAASKKVAKHTRRNPDDNGGLLRNVCATVAGPLVTRMSGYSTSDGTKVETVAPNVDGRFPPAADIWVDIDRTEPTATVAVDPALLARALEGMAALGVKRVRLELRPNKVSSGAPRPIAIHAESDELPQSIESAKALVCVLAPAE